MKIKIDRNEWEIIECESNNSMLLVDNTRQAGTTHFFHKHIYVDNTLEVNTFRKILRHEIAHAILYETQIRDLESYTEEDMCNFMGMYGDMVVEVAESYMRKREGIDDKHI